MTWFTHDTDVWLHLSVGELPAQEIAHTVLLGELGLDGRLRPVRGVLPALLAARRAEIDRAVVPTSSLTEAALLPDVRVIGADRLAAAVARLCGLLIGPVSVASAATSAPPRPSPRWGALPSMSNTARRPAAARRRTRTPPRRSTFPICLTLSGRWRWRSRRPPPVTGRPSRRRVLALRHAAAPAAARADQSPLRSETVT